jgi:DNA-nicking Smr family endonuclease
MIRKSGNKGTYRAISPEDAELFDLAMRDVQRRSSGASGSIPEKKKHIPPRIDPVEKTPIKVQKPSEAPALIAGNSVDLDHRTMVRLRRGQIRPESRLDLHGLTQSEAYDELKGFVQNETQAGSRCVLVITGKGRISQGGGVLRNHLPNWLNHPDFRPLTLGFSEAQPRDGGSGAFYIMLRRKRIRG